MRTTLNLDDALMREVKRRAADRGQSMTEIIDQALRDHLHTEARTHADYEFNLPTVAGQRRPGVDFSDRDALYELMESSS